MGYALYPDCFNVVGTDKKETNIDRYEIIKMILEKDGSDPNGDDLNGMTPIMTAVERQDLKVVNIIMKSKRFDVRYKYSDNTNIITRLIKEINKFSKIGEQEKIYLYVFNKLIEMDKGILYERDYYGKHALMYVVDNDNGFSFKLMRGHDIPIDELKNLYEYATKIGVTVNMKILEGKIKNVNKK